MCCRRKRFDRMTRSWVALMEDSHPGVLGTRLGFCDSPLEALPGSDFLGGMPDPASVIASISAGRDTANRSGLTLRIRKASAY